MRRLGLVLVGLAAAFVLIDVGLRLYVQYRVEAEFRNAAQVPADGVDFSIDSFPFVGRLLAFGEVSATLRLREVGDQRIGRIDEFEAEVDGLVFDRDQAFRGEVLVTGLDRATVRATIEQDTLSELFGVPVELRQVQAQVTDGGLVFTVPGVGEQAVSLPARDYFPCDPSISVSDAAVELACTTTDLPPMVNQVIGRATRR